MLHYYTPVAHGKFEIAKGSDKLDIPCLCAAQVSIAVLRNALGVPTKRLVSRRC